MSTALHEHLEELRDALLQEMGAARKEHLRIESLPRAIRLTLGQIWPQVHVTPVGRWGRRAHLHFEAPPNTRLHDGIRNGDAINVQLPGGDFVVGVVVGLAESKGELLVEADEVQEGQAWVSARFDPTTFENYIEGLERANEHRSLLKSVLLKTRQPDPPWGPDLSFPLLDEAQAHAAKLAVGAMQLQLIWGPPGTGKTRVLASVLQQLVKEGIRPWALASSNAAVDHLAVSAAHRGLEVVRVGHPARLGTEAAKLSLESRLQSSPLAPALQALERDLAKSWTDRRARRELLAHRDEMRAQARAHILADAQVIACTFGTLAKRAHVLPTTKVAVVDEATQVIEPALWSAVPFIERLILVGDPKQLGPVVKSNNKLLSRSGFERLLEDGHNAPALTVQRRMNSKIRSLVADVYGPEYTDHKSNADQHLSDLPGCTENPIWGDEPVLFVDTAGSDSFDQRDEITGSTYNERELKVLTVAIDELLRVGISPSDIGVITPYSAQVSRITALKSFKGVEVSTVNAFQGREKEVILCSFVRSNHDGDMGFVEDERRLVVALTRAKRLLFCTGDSSTLGNSRAFANFFDHVGECGGWRTVWEDPWA